jgi:hypothetical protein
MAELSDLIAYELYPQCGVSIVPAAVDRDWMDSTGGRFAYRCLPLNIANQNGWLLLNRTEFEAYWYGGRTKADIEVRYIGQPDNHAYSHFGEGVLTFSVPYIFRTPPGINLWVKGPANILKDGIQALEGVVETDWSPATFTMNWHFTRPFEWIRFKKGEPFAMIVPIPRGLTETFSPRKVSIRTNPELKAQYDRWDIERRTFLDGLERKVPEVVARSWQKDYFQGKAPDGTTAGQHQTKLVVKPFADGDET